VSTGSLSLEASQGSAHRCRLGPTRSTSGCKIEGELFSTLPGAGLLGWPANYARSVASILAGNARSPQNSVLLLRPVQGRPVSPARFRRIFRAAVTAKPSPTCRGPGLARVVLGSPTQNGQFAPLRRRPLSLPCLGPLRRGGPGLESDLGRVEPGGGPLLPGEIPKSTPRSGDATVGRRLPSPPRRSRSAGPPGRSVA